jgi:hypothetical protein
VALVIRIGYFCSAGHTELGARALPTGGVEPAAIGAFLSKISAGIEWTRAYPAVEKPGPKPGRARTSFKEPTDGGVTGAALINKMRERLEKYYRGNACDIDVVVLIDDADCRFLEDGALLRWTSDRERDVRAWTERPELRFVALIASPEIEAWLLADWEEGFGREYSAIHVPLGRALERDLLGARPWERVEDFGGPYDPQKGSCTRKLSDEVNKVLGELAMQKGGPVDRRTYTYSKGEQGPDMLRRVRPEKIAEVCRSVFRPAYLQILALAACVRSARRGSP